MIHMLRWLSVWLLVITIVIETLMPAVAFAQEETEDPFFIASAAITQLIFSAGPTLADQGSITGPFTITAQDSSGIATAVPNGSRLLLSSDRAGTFYNANLTSKTCTSLISASSNEIAFTGGTKNKGFCYQPSVVGDHTLTISAKNQSWTPAVRSVTVSGPSLVGAVVVDRSTITITTSHPIEAMSLQPTDFTLPGHTPVVASLSGQTITLTVTPELGDNEQPLVTLAGLLTDIDGRAIAPGSVKAVDLIVPGAPTDLAIDHTTGSPAGVINRSNVSGVGVSVRATATAVLNDRIRFTLSDQRGASVSSSVMSSGPGEVVRATLDTGGLQDGAISMSATTIDVSGNVSHPATASSSKDTLAPEQIELLINGGASHTNRIETSLTIRVTGATTFRLSNDNVVFTDAIAVPAQGQNFTLGWNIAPFDGSKTVYAIFSDQAANQELFTSKIFLTSDLVAVAVPTKIEGGGQATIDETGVSGIELTVGAKSNTSGTQLSTSVFSRNPRREALPDGTTVVGTFRDVTFSRPENVVLPAVIKVYYTQSELEAVQITNEEQLLGVARFSSLTGSWELLPGGIKTSSDKSGFAGYAFAQMTSFSPVVLLADVAPPSASAGLTLTPTPDYVGVEWTGVAEAQSYVVEFRKTSQSKPVRVNVGNRTITSIINLEPGEQYIVGVRAVDRGGNESGVIEQTARVHQDALPVVTLPETTDSVESSPAVATSGPITAPQKPKASVAVTPKTVTEVLPPKAEDQPKDNPELSAAQAAGNELTTRRGQITLAVLVLLAVLAAAVVYQLLFKESYPLKKSDRHAPPQPERKKW